MANNFKIVIDSADGQEMDNTTNSNLRYFYDFSRHKKGLYEISYTYMGGINNFFGINEVPCELHIEGINLISNSRAKQNSMSSTNCIGIVYPKIVNQTTGLGFLYSGENHKSLTMLPTNNYFIVKTLAFDGEYWLDSTYTLNNATPPVLILTPKENAGYVMILHFRYLEP